MDASRPFKKALATNAANTSFASKAPTVTEPSGDGVHRLSGDGAGGVVPCSILIVPYGTGDANDVFDMRIIGWRRIGSGPAPGTLWVPTIIAGLTCTLGAATGVAGSPVVATELFADTISVTTGMEPVLNADVTDGGTIEVFSPTGDLIAWAQMAVRGFEKLEFTFDMTTNDPTGANALFAFV